MSVAWMIGAFVLILTPIIFIHELGHFVFARLFGIRVEEFGLGFPPRAVKLFERGGTIYSLNWIPIGGFVRPAGEGDPSVPGGLAGASKTARFFVLSAGALFNFLFALLIFWFANVVGPPAISVNRVDPNSPAEAAGMLEGDVLLAINGLEIEDDSRVLQDAVRENAGTPVELLLIRDGEEILIVVTPRTEGAYNAEVEGPLGIELGTATNFRYPDGPAAAFVSAAKDFWNVIYTTVSIPVLIMQGEISAAEARPVGPIGISQILGVAARATVEDGNVYLLLQVTAFISVALGFTNLLPIPALDGGRIMFVLIEAIRGRPVEPEREGMVHLVGMIILLGLMLILIFQDIINPIISF